jgi:hypothetical protein
MTRVAGGGAATIVHDPPWVAIRRTRVRGNGVEQRGSEAGMGSWFVGIRRSEELDVDPRELVQKIREHRGEGLIDLDAPGAPGSETEAEAVGGSGDPVGQRPPTVTAG